MRQTKIFPSTGAIKSMDGYVGFLDFDGNYIDRFTGLRIFVGLNAKMCGSGYILVDDILYRLARGRELELVESVRDVKLVFENDAQGELYIMTNSGTYIFE